MAINYNTKNTFTLRDADGDATYITGKGKSAETVLENILPTYYDYEYYWNIHAGASDDLIDARGSTLYARLYGDTGNDTIYSSTGYFNYIEGGDGNDLIDARLAGTADPYPSGYTQLLGGSGNDTIYGGWGEDYIDGGSGRDIINAGDGYDRVVYDPNDIRVEADGGFDTIDASSAAATNVRTGKGVTIDLGSNRDAFFNFEAVIGSKFNDTLTGDNANNFFDGGDGNDTINAGGGEDTVVYDANDTSVDGGFDRDSLTGEDSPFGVTIDLTGTTHRNFEEVYGSRFNDVIKGDGSNSYIDGNNGDDFIDGGAGRDDINPGYGNDTWVYDAADYVYEWSDPSHQQGIDTIDASTAPEAVVIEMSDNYPNHYSFFENLIGSAWADELTGNEWDNVIEGGAGADLIDGGGDSMFGDTASYAGSAAAVTVDLGAGTASGGDAAGDVLSNIENLIGSAYADTLTGKAGRSYLEGGAGADHLAGGGLGDASADYASYAGSAVGVTVNLATPTENSGDAEGDTYSDIDGLMGSSFNDILIGDAQDNVIVDGPSSYVFSFYYYSTHLVSGQGDDWIDGGAGNDWIMTGAGQDTVMYDAADNSVSDQGDWNVFGTQINTIDTVDASTSSAGVTIDLNSNYYGFDIIIGSAFGDTLTGNDYDNLFMGGADADSLDGSWGSDTASYAGSAAAVAVDLGTPSATGGDAEGDTFASIENLIGSAYADTLTGDSNNNVLEGGAGGDALSGGDGSDTASYLGSTEAVTVDLGLGTLSGGDATGDTLISIENLIGSNFSDTLTGDAGNNRIEGAGGADVMNGGSGEEPYVYNTYVYKSVSESVEGQMDTISGFRVGDSGDVIDCAVALRDLDYLDVAYYTTALDSFSQIKAEAQKVMASYWFEAFVATDGSDSYVFMNGSMDGSYDAGSDMVIQLVGVNDLSTLSASNFYADIGVWVNNIDNLG